MSVSDLPEYQQLMEMLRKVTGDPDKITSLAGAWRSASGDLNEFAGELGAAVEVVDDAWKGRSADQFDTYMRKYGRAAEELKGALSSCASSLDGVASALREARTEISAIRKDLVTNAHNYEVRYFANNSEATEEDVKPELRRMVNEALGEARPWLNKAKSAVHKAQGDINRFLTERELLFRDIPDVTLQEFTPAPGRKIEWKPDPGYQTQDRTSLEGHRGGGSAGGGGSTGGYGGYGPSGPPPPGGGPAPTGQVKEWIEQAIEILTRHGVPASKMNANDIWMIIQHESGGNPNAINNWDSNADRGTPSKGLMQTIDPTFNAHKLPGHGNIYDPVDNIIAGVRYAISRYGSVSNVPGVVNTKNGLDYVGY
ncbi:WXG100 family type VII secretion target [Nonomuraea polychroma]|uniref:WXG100 family type VII secretion target n=1 Tax=Nonomuraea polychroma TaxID=46176 RepID=A0A438MP88_9ACTN|nr:transglycosylase SLT domain-containing protein [Nonomuraea polychroma]RVX47339.1 WXG100 family type VII secretion target [Nonomuraea polychroma]